MEHFDNVVIATPFHQAALGVAPPLASEPERIQYTPIHTTSFISERLPDRLLLQPHGERCRHLEFVSKEKVTYSLVVD